MGRDHPVPCRDDAALAGLGSMERVLEQIVGAPVPQIWEPIVEGVQLAPQERVENRIPDPIVDIPVPQILEAAVEVVSSTPQERVQNHMREQIVDVPVPRIMEATVEVLPQERVLHRTPEPVVDVPVPQITAQIGDFVQPVPPERTHERIVEQISVVPQTIEKLGDFVQLVPSERIQERILDQISLVLQKISLVLQIMEKIEVAVQPVPSERVPERIVEQISVVSQTTEEQIVGVLVPQIIEDSLPASPQERVQNRTPEQVVDFSVPRTMEAIVEVVAETAQERVLIRTPEPVVDVPVPQLIEASLPFVPQERVLNRTQQIVGVPVLPIMEAAVEKCVGEQIVDCPLPQIMEAVWPSTPWERVQNRTPELIMDPPVPQLQDATLPSTPQEQIMDSRVPQIMEAVVQVLPSTPQERVQNCTQEQIADTPVPQIMEAVGEVVLTTPQECVQNRTPEQIVDLPVSQIVQESVQIRTLEQVRVHSRIQEQIVDLPVPQTMAVLRPKTGKVFTVEMPHQHVHQACPGDHVLFNIKGLDKHKKPQSGDVMVPAAQIQEQSVDVGGSGIVREIPEEKVVERIQDSAAFGGAEHDQQETPAGDGRCSSSSSVSWRPELHPSWRQTVTRDGSVYFWHVHTRQTQWDPPKDDEGEDEHFDTEDVEEDDARGIGSRFHGSFRPQRFCRVFGAGCCWRGAECSFAHSASELHPLSPDLHL